MTCTPNHKDTHHLKGNDMSGGTSYRIPTSPKIRRQISKDLAVDYSNGLTMREIAQNRGLHYSQVARLLHESSILFVARPTGRRRK